MTEIKKKTVTSKENILIKLWQMLKKPIFAGILLGVAIICFVVYAVLPSYPYEQKDGRILFDKSEKFCTSNDDWKAIVDDRDVIYCLNENDSFIYAVHIDDFSYEKAPLYNFFKINN